MPATAALSNCASQLRRTDSPGHVLTNRAHHALHQLAGRGSHLGAGGMQVDGRRVRSLALPILPGSGYFGPCTGTPPPQVCDSLQDGAGRGYFTTRCGAGHMQPFLKATAGQPMSPAYLLPPLPAVQPWPLAPPRALGPPERCSPATAAQSQYQHGLLLRRGQGGAEVVATWRHKSIGGST